MIGYGGYHALVTYRLMKLLVFLFSFVASSLSWASTVRVGTLNCYLLFAPGVQHPGKVDDENPLTPEQYAEKTRNLGELARRAEFVGLQEVGGEIEVRALAKAADMEYAFALGRDTATGENVGALFRLPGWRIVSHGRVPQLDRLLSKHLLVVAESPDRIRVQFLVVHLLRPMNSLERHQGQIDGVSRWVSAQDGVVVVVGDMNDSTFSRGSSIIGVGVEAGELNGYAGTHLDNKPFDRLVAVGPVSWQGTEIVRPPYGKRPAAAAKRVWTDHYFLVSTLVLPGK